MIKEQKNKFHFFIQQIKFILFQNAIENAFAISLYNLIFAAPI